MDPIDQILDKLMRDVEASVHAFYRGDVRQNTQRIRTDTFRNAARQALEPLLSGAAAAPAAAAGAPLTPDETAAALRCVMGWLPMGPPADARADARCIAGAREMSPTWGERELARLALRRATA